MSKRYYTLLSRENAESPWVREFGAFEREDVTSELEDYVDHDHKRKNLRIITTAPTDIAISRAVLNLNASLAS